MPNSDQRSIEYTDDFVADLKYLLKRFRHIESDLQPLLDELQSGAIPGDRIPNIPEVVYKVRLANSDARRGKRGGYRVIYEIKGQKVILMLTVYSKTDQGDISTGSIIEIVRRHGASAP
ncbi:MAG: type II toxin-antitoxin system RelE/ParE family toxin [Caldilineaceae bacterium]